MLHSLQMIVLTGLLLSDGSALVDARLKESNTTASGDSEPADRVLVLIDGQPITEGDLGLLMLTYGLPDEQKTTSRRLFLKQLVDRRIMRAYLKSRKAKADKIELDERLARLKKKISKAGDDPTQFLARLGYTEKTLREELSLPLAWQSYFNRVVTPKTIRDYYKKYRQQFDGTEVRASQIFLKLGKPQTDVDKNKALEKLQQIRTDVLGGKITFAEAATKYSQAPTRDKGGDVGFFPYRGKMPRSFTRVVFPLAVGDLSKPFISPFGAHLATLTERKPGDLSLEDARATVLSRMSGQLWRKTTAEQRAKTKIEWKTDSR